MRSLEADGLLVRGAPVRGRVGQPSIPMRLNPDAVYSFGVKIGRRSADLVLMDFLGTIRLHLHQIHTYPLPEEIVSFIVGGIGKLEGQLDTGERGRIAGVGIATPFELWNWSEEVGAPREEMDRWRDFDLQAAVASRIRHPVFLQNDGTSACGAELAFGVGASYPDFVYFYIGSFIGGGVVINSALFSGRTGTAGAVGPLPVAGKDGKSTQLLKIASVFVLEKLLRERGIGRRLDRFRRAARNMDPGCGGGACTSRRLRGFRRRFFGGRDRRRLSALGAGAPSCSDAQGPPDARPAGRHGSGPRRRHRRQSRPRDRRRKPAALLPLSAGHQCPLQGALSRC
jgi:predicted NBD/HSP70 family sugar kinase